MNLQNITIKFALLLMILINLNSCGIYRPVSAKDYPPEPEKRIQKNLQEGRGFQVLGGNKKGGDFDFATSNEMWRASLDILDFMPLTSADYGGGLIITDWYSESKSDEAIKVTIRFLSPEIRADGLEISIHQKKCEINNLSNCTVQKLDTKLAEEIKLAILKRAVQIDKKITEKKRKEFKKKFPDYKSTGNQSAN